MLSAGRSSDSSKTTSIINPVPGTAAELKEANVLLCYGPEGVVVAALSILTFITKLKVMELKFSK